MHVVDWLSKSQQQADAPTSHVIRIASKPWEQWCDTQRQTTVC